MMKFQNRKTPWWTRVACTGALVLLGACGALADVDGIITKTDGQTLRGKVRYQAGSRKYVVTDKDNISIDVLLSRVKEIRTREPVELKPAIQLVQGGKYSQAIPALEGIVKAYQMLQHDVLAASWLAEAYLKSGSADKAVATCDNLLANHPLATLPGNAIRVYLDALLGTEDFAKLRRILDKMVQEGGREAAAVAQVKRGDMDKKQGNVKEALVDGYLRTVVLYEDIKHVQSEALYKACKCFEELGQHSHAERMRKRLLEDFPKDPYSQRMRAGA